MSHAIVDLYDSGEQAGVRAQELRLGGWNVALSGPNAEGTDVHVEANDDPSHYDQGWIVLASKTPIATD